MKSGTFKAKQVPCKLQPLQGGLTRLENWSNIHPLSPVETDAERQSHCSDVPPAEGGDGQVINRSLKVTRALPSLMEQGGALQD